jgi:transcriptional regulator with XRE-family HTH domain
MPNFWKKPIIVCNTGCMKLRDIGKAVKELRIAKEMTQQELIEKADLSRSQLYYIEAGKRTPQLPTLQSICTALEISLLDLVQHASGQTVTSVTPSISSMEAPGATIG